MSPLKQFAAGAALGTVVAAAATILNRDKQPVTWAKERIEDLMTGGHEVEFEKPLDPVLIRHKQPVVDGDDPLFNAWG